MGNKHPKGITKCKPDLNSVVNYLQHSEFFIGISSGLSWLSWSLNVPTILISGFSEEYTEPITNVERIINKKSPMIAHRAL